jgi:hypothetical protein
VLVANRILRIMIKYFSPRIIFEERKDIPFPISTKTQIGKTNNLIVQQEEYNMSDLANSCEYLTSEKLCLAASESEKARSSRQVRCKNSEKMTCCYLCMFVLDCATPCRFLGNTENGPPQKETEKTQIDITFNGDKKPEKDKTENTPSTYCSSCNVKMSQTRTKFRIYGWEGTKQKSADNDSARLVEEILPLIVYLCPKCGKIDFKADDKLNKN